MLGTTTILRAPGELEQREYEVPEPSAGGLIVEMIRANVCGSEVHIVKGHHPLVREGCVPGHEGVGRVARLAPGVDRDFAGTPLQVGDRVVATYFAACRRCPPCNRGQLTLCDHGYDHWGTQADVAPHFHGTFGTHWAIGPDQYVFRVPDDLSSIAVSSANCALSQMVATVRAGDVRRGERVLFLGAGGLGLCGAALAAEIGAEVTVAEMAPGRLAKASTFGAHHTLDLSAAEDGAGRVDLARTAIDGGADVVVDLTGVPAAFGEGLQMVRKGGRYLSVGNISPGRLAEIDPGSFTRSGASIQAVMRYAPYLLSRSLEFIRETPEYPWADLVDADFAFDDAAAAVQAAADRKVTRAALLIGEDS